jgi:hypothetical protein
MFSFDSIRRGFSCVASSVQNAFGSTEAKTQSAAQEVFEDSSVGASSSSGAPSKPRSWMHQITAHGIAKIVQAKVMSLFAGIARFFGSLFGKAQDLFSSESEEDSEPTSPLEQIKRTLSSEALRAAHRASDIASDATLSIGVRVSEACGEFAGDVTAEALDTYHNVKDLAEDISTRVPGIFDRVGSSIQRIFQRIFSCVGSSQ